MRQSLIALRNSITGLFSQAVAVGTAVFLTPFVVNRIGREAMGVYLLAMSIVAALQVLRAPAGRTCTVEVAKGHEVGDQERVNRTINASVLFSLVVALVGFVVLAGGSELLYRFFDIAAGLHRQAVVVFMLAGVMVLFAVPAFPFVGVVMGHQRHHVLYGLNAVERLARAGLIVLLLLVFSPTVITIMAVSVGVMIAVQLAVVLYACRLEPSYRLRWRGVRLADFGMLLSFGGMVLLTQVLVMLDKNVAQWITGRAIGTGVVTDLWVASMLAVLAYRLVSQVSIVLVPIASRYTALADERRLQELFRRGSRYAFIMAAGVLGVLLPIMDVFLHVWMGPKFTWIAPYAIVFGGVVLVSSSSSCSYQILQGMGDAKRPFCAVLVAFVGGVGTMLVGITVLDQGFAAIIAGLCVGQALRWLIMTWLAMRKIGGSWAALVWHAYLQPVIALAPAVGAVLALKWFLRLEGWPGLLLVLGVGLLVYGLSLLPLLSASEWELIRAGLGKVRSVLGLERGSNSDRE